jgi:hypothetical protein
MYVNGEWIKAKSGKTFEAHGEKDPNQTALPPTMKTLI